MYETTNLCDRKGDYYRYLAEFGPEKDRKRFGESSHQAYKMAYKRALATLEPLDPTRLGLALNFSVFYHGMRHYQTSILLILKRLSNRLDVYKSPDRACHLAKSAFDDAVQCLDPSKCPVDLSLRDSLSILQLLRDDLLLWSEEL